MLLHFELDALGKPVELNLVYPADAFPVDGQHEGTTLGA